MNYRAIEEAFAGRFADYTDPKPRLEALYTDARRTWLESKSAAYDLHAFLVAAAFERREVSVEDDAQLRLAYGIPRREAQ